MKILNLTQHQPTPEQVSAGVTQPNQEAQKLLNFQGLYPHSLVVERSKQLVALAEVLYAQAEDEAELGDDLPGSVMIGGLPALMPPLESGLLKAGFGVCYAISDRVSEEQAQPDGSVRKALVFKHIGFCEVDYGS